MNFKNINKFDLIFTISVLILSLMFLKLFFDDINRIYEHTAKSVGTITFKRNRAQRQVTDSLKWERIKNESPVYNGDTIRTDRDSSAALKFEDTTALELADNTLIRVRFLDDYNDISFLKGNISFDRQNSSDKRMRVNISDGGTVDFDKDSVASIIQNGDNISIGVDKGSAVYTNKDEKFDITKEKELNINTSSGKLSIRTLSIFTQSPQANSRFMAIGKDRYDIEFICGGEGLNEKGAIKLQISSSPDFSTDLSEFNGIEAAGVYRDGKLFVNQSISAGTWFWRMGYNADKNSEPLFSAVRRISVYSEERTRTIAPSNGKEFRFKKNLPEISLTWTGSERANAYILKVADNEALVNPIINLRTTHPEVKTDKLTQGKWYWQVTPVYPFITQDTLHSSISSFHITKSPEPIKLQTLLPIDNTLYELVTVKENGIGFSWKSEGEAISYQIGLSATPDMKQILSTKDTQQTWTMLGQEDSKQITLEGSRYWAVRYKDIDGEFSPWSDAKKITGVDGVVSKRIIYPPDEYTVADTLLSNLRFSWKTNIPAAKYFEVSSRIDFDSIVYRESVQAETLLGLNLPIGKYYWRIRTLNSNGTVFLDSAIRSFSVEPPLSPAKIKTPADGSTVIAYSETQSKIEWEPVNNAEFYSVEIYAGAKPVFISPIYTETSVETSFIKYGNSDWTIKIQAAANQTEKSTRLLGLISKAGFKVRILKPIVISTPKNGASISGLTAVKDGIHIKWDSEEKLSEQTLIVSRDPDKTDVVYSKHMPEKTTAIPDLRKGTYYIDLLGLTDEGFVIKTANPLKITVSDIPPLPAPTGLAPSNKSSIGFDYLKKNKSIIFSWNPVNDAMTYEFSLYRVSNNKRIAHIPVTKMTSYTFKELALLSRGDFRWEVSAKASNEKLKYKQDGLKAIAVFTLDIPEINKPTIDSGQGLYGQ